MLATTRAGDSKEAGQWWHRQWAAQALGDGAGEKRRAREGALGSEAAREKVLKELNENGGEDFYKAVWQLKGLPGSRRAAGQKFRNYSELSALHHIYLAKIKTKSI